MAKLSVKDLRSLVSGRSVKAGKESLTFTTSLPDDKKELEGLRDEIETILTDGAEPSSNPGDDLDDVDGEEEDFDDEDDFEDEDEDEDLDDDEDDEDYEFEDEDEEP